MMPSIPEVERFYADTEVKSGEVHLWCPSCNWAEPLGTRSSTIGAMQAMAREHLAERHKPESRCEVCGEPVSGWDYESFTEDTQIGRGLTVRPCGHKVDRIVAVIP